MKRIRVHSPAETQGGKGVIKIELRAIDMDDHDGMRALGETLVDAVDDLPSTSERDTSPRELDSADE
jgi:hypothetical protein